MKLALCGALVGVVSLSAQDGLAVIKQDDPAVIKKKLAEVQAQINEVKVLGGAMINGPTVKSAPYSSQVVNETVQTLADGNHIKSGSSSMVYRDSQGRERREETRKGAVSGIFITDPVEGASYMLMPGTKEARKTAPMNFVFTPGEHLGGGVGVGIGGGRGGQVTTETRSFSFSAGGGGQETFVFSNSEVNSSKANTKVEHLGSQTIEGVTAEGTRTTVTIPEGQIGNELPIVTVSERWYSPELQVTVMSTRSDPRTGTTTYKLTNINRAEPAPSLFQVPADYTIHDLTTAPRGYAVKPDERL
jgi:hypothetical protein